MIRCTGRLLCYVPLVCYDTGGASLSLGIGRTVVNSVVDSISYPFLIIIVIIKILVVAVRTQNHRNIEHIRWDGWLVGWLFIVIATKQSYYLLSDHHTTSTNETNEKCFFLCLLFVRQSRYLWCKASRNDARNSECSLKRTKQATYFTPESRLNHVNDMSNLLPNFK